MQVTTVEKSILVLYKQHAKVVDDQYRTYFWPEWALRSAELSHDPEEVKKYTGLIRSPSVQIFSPQVIYFPDCEAESPEIRTIKFSRKNVFVRDRFTCQYCGNKYDRENLSMDHIIPKSKGGPSTYTNIVTACKPCNRWKDDRTPEQAGMTLLKKPTAPRWKSHVGKPFSQIKQDYWALFLK